MHEHYLENVLRTLGKNPAEPCWKLLSRPSSSPAGAEKALLELVRDLIVQCHEQDGDLSHSFLVFLPTWRIIELQHQMLEKLDLPLSCYALHRCCVRGTG